MPDRYKSNENNGKVAIFFFNISFVTKLYFDIVYCSTMRTWYVKIIMRELHVINNRYFVYVWSSCTFFLQLIFKLYFHSVGNNVVLYLNGLNVFLYGGTCFRKQKKWLILASKWCIMYRKRQHRAISSRIFDIYNLFLWILIYSRNP